VPYGVKSVATIEHFTGQITDYLLDQGVKMLIIACNTMAAVASQVVKDKAGAIPVLDVIEAGARAAVAESPLRAIGVIGTRPPSTATPTPAGCTPSIRTCGCIPRPARCSCRWSRRAGWTTR
jgi:glutamate racemase